MKYTFISLFLLICAALSLAQTVDSNLPVNIARHSNEYLQWYKQLHSNPELSCQEEKTSAFLKEQMKKMGYEITENLGYHSFAAILRNGSGKTILYRTDMDALPVKELTELEYASLVTATKGQERVSVMHACGHDFHMSSWLGTAQLMSELRNKWQGTLIFLAQSAEETGQGAKQVMASPGFAQLPIPDYQLAFHDHPELPVGQIGFCDEYIMAAVDIVEITFYGKGGHGAMPDRCIDPILMASQFVTQIQSIVSRNLPPIEPGVVTVGSFHAGSVGNVIPDEAQLKLTIRSYSASARQLIIDRIKTIASHIALGAGMPESKLPLVTLLDMSIPSVYNTPELGVFLRSKLKPVLGEQAITMVKPLMVGEDFGYYGYRKPSVPSYLLWIGTVEPERKEKASRGEATLYPLHSPHFAPYAKTGIPAAIRIMSTALLSLLR